jgi:predicted peptidase
MRKPVPLLIVLALALTSCASPKRLSLSPGEQTAREAEWKIKKAVRTQYLLYLPRDYDPQSGRRWPMILFLHGAGERGTNVWKAATHGPPRIVKDKPDFPFIVLSPQCPGGEEWSNANLLKLLGEVIGAHAVDTNRIYLTGLSMGGYGTWDLGLRYPERFAAIAPICGGGSLIPILLAAHGYAPDKLVAMKTLGVWAFHGANDKVVPPAESERMVEALKTIKPGDIRYTVYPDAGHDAWSATYNNPELYEWFLKHERKFARAASE